MAPPVGRRSVRFQDVEVIELPIVPGAEHPSNNRCLVFGSGGEGEGGDSAAITLDWKAQSRTTIDLETYESSKNTKAAHAKKKGSLSQIFLPRAVRKRMLQKQGFETSDIEDEQDPSDRRRFKQKKQKKGRKDKNERRIPGEKTFRQKLRTGDRFASSSSSGGESSSASESGLSRSRRLDAPPSLPGNRNRHGMSEDEEGLGYDRNLNSYSSYSSYPPRDLLLDPPSPRSPLGGSSPKRGNKSWKKKAKGALGTLATKPVRSIAKSTRTLAKQPGKLARSTRKRFKKEYRSSGSDDDLYYDDDVSKDQSNTFTSTTRFKENPIFDAEDDDDAVLRLERNQENFDTSLRSRASLESVTSSEHHGHQNVFDTSLRSRASIESVTSTEQEATLNPNHWPPAQLSSTDCERHRRIRNTKGPCAWSSDDCEDEDTERQERHKVYSNFDHHMAADKVGLSPSVGFSDSMTSESYRIIELPLAVGFSSEDEAALTGAPKTSRRGNIPKALGSLAKSPVRFAKSTGKRIGRGARKMKKGKKTLPGADNACHEKELTIVSPMAEREDSREFVLNEDRRTLLHSDMALAASLPAVPTLLSSDDEVAFVAKDQRHDMSFSSVDEQYAPGPVRIYTTSLNDIAGLNDASGSNGFTESFRVCGLSSDDDVENTDMPQRQRQRQNKRGSLGHVLGTLTKKPVRVAKSTPKALGTLAKQPVRLASYTHKRLSKGRRSKSPKRPTGANNWQAPSSAKQQGDLFSSDEDDFVSSEDDDFLLVPYPISAGTGSNHNGDNIGVYFSSDHDEDRDFDSRRDSEGATLRHPMRGSRERRGRLTHTLSSLAKQPVRLAKSTRKRISMHMKRKKKGTEDVTTSGSEDDIFQSSEDDIGFCESEKALTTLQGTNQTTEDSSGAEYDDDGPRFDVQDHTDEFSQHLTPEKTLEGQGQDEGGFSASYYEIITSDQDKATSHTQLSGDNSMSSPATRNSSDQLPLQSVAMTLLQEQVQPSLEVHEEIEQVQESQNVTSASLRNKHSEEESVEESSLKSPQPTQQQILTVENHKFGDCDPSELLADQSAEISSKEGNSGFLNHRAELSFRIPSLSSQIEPRKTDLTTTSELQNHSQPRRRTQSLSKAVEMLSKEFNSFSDPLQSFRNPQRLGSKSGLTSGYDSDSETDVSKIRRPNYVRSSSLKSLSSSPRRYERSNLASLGRSESMRALQVQSMPQRAKKKRRERKVSRFHFERSKSNKSLPSIPTRDEIPSHLRLERTGSIKSIQNQSAKRRERRVSRFHFERSESMRSLPAMPHREERTKRSSMRRGGSLRALHTQTVKRSERRASRFNVERTESMRSLPPVPTRCNGTEPSKLEPAKITRCFPPVPSRDKSPRRSNLLLTRANSLKCLPPVPKRDESPRRPNLAPKRAKSLKSLPLQLNEELADLEESENFNGSPLATLRERRFSRFNLERTASMQSLPPVPRRQDNFSGSNLERTRSMNSLPPVPRRHVDVPSIVGDSEVDVPETKEVMPENVSLQCNEGSTAPLTSAPWRSMSVDSAPHLPTRHDDIGFSTNMSKKDRFKTTKSLPKDLLGRSRNMISPRRIATQRRSLRQTIIERSASEHCDSALSSFSATIHVSEKSARRIGSMGDTFHEVETSAVVLSLPKPDDGVDCSINSSIHDSLPSIVGEEENTSVPLVSAESGDSSYMDESHPSSQFSWTCEYASSNFEAERQAIAMEGADDEFPTPLHYASSNQHEGRGSSGRSSRSGRTTPTTAMSKRISWTGTVLTQSSSSDISLDL